MNGTINSTTIAASGSASVMVGGLSTGAEVNLAGAAAVSLGVTSGEKTG